MHVRIHTGIYIYNVYMYIPGFVGVYMYIEVYTYRYIQVYTGIQVYRRCIRV